LTSNILRVQEKGIQLGVSDATKASHSHKTWTEVSSSAHTSNIKDCHQPH